MARLVTNKETVDIIRSRREDKNDVKTINITGSLEKFMNRNSETSLMIDAPNEEIIGQNVLIVNDSQTDSLYIPLKTFFDNFSFVEEEEEEYES